jgi:hypothetical protein
MDSEREIYLDNNATTRPLPQVREALLDIGALSRAFRHTTNSYKYLFFISLLNVLRDREFRTNEPISFDELVQEMLITAWYPHCFFRLSFGSQDKIASVLDSMELPIKNMYGPRELRHLIAGLPRDDVLHDLLRYVPYRLLRVFFAEETRGMNDAQVNVRLAHLSSKHFASRRPLYCFTDRCSAIRVHPIWAEYLHENFAIVLAWASWKWGEYMQDRNPSVPAVARKLFPPVHRDSLQRQRQYWEVVIERKKDIKCIYSGEPLADREDRFALDHFLPWSFVVHDQLWNLLPVAPEANSSKSDQLPSEQYLEGLVALQHTGLKVSKPLMGKKWLSYAEPYLTDLKIESSESLLDLEKLRSAYRNTVLPLLSLAERQGFSANWTYLAGRLTLPMTTDVGERPYRARSSSSPQSS